MSDAGIWTDAAIKKLERYEFPGGYSPYATRGDCRFDWKAAALAVNVAPRFFRHTKGDKGGEPFELELWEAGIVATLFGWKRPDGRRRYRQAHVEVPRGNGKSALCMVLVGILLYLDDEPGAEIFSAAGTREQAKEVFGPFKINVLANPDLSSISQCYLNSITRIDPQSGVPCGVYKAISADAGVQHGGSPHGVIFDELHVQRTRDLWDVLHTGKVKRAQPLTIAITTAGFDRSSICWEQHQYAISVRDGLRDDRSFLPVIYAADDADDWTSPEVWRKANPNLGVSIREEDLAEECRRAQDLPSYENTFKRLHLNLWTEADVRWMPMAAWDKCTDKIPDAELLGRTCWAGLDLASNRDLCSLVLCFPFDDGRYALKSFFWAPKDSATLRQRQDKQSYLGFASAGHITLTPGNAMDEVAICEAIVKCGKLYDVRDLLFDPHNAQPVWGPLMRDHGWPEDKIHEFLQRVVTYNDPMKQMLSLVLEGKIVHGGHPVLRWNFANLVVRPDANGDIKPEKGRSGDKIDGACAAIMALAGALECKPKSESVYETRGILTL